MSGPGFVLEIKYVGRPPEVRAFSETRTTIGRDAGDIVLSDPASSASHAEILYEDGQLVIRDLGSTNGTWLGDRRLQQFAVGMGESFRCGNTVMHVRTVIGGEAYRAGGTVLSGAISEPRGRQAQAKAPLAKPKVNLATVAAVPETPSPEAPSPETPTPTPAPTPAPASPVLSRGVSILGYVVVLAILAAIGGGVYAWRSWSAPEDDDDDGEPAEQDVSEKTSTGAEELAAKPEPEPFGVPKEADLGEIYRAVGAATVVIKVPGTVGSGAIINLPDGATDERVLVLTNHHVIADGEFEGLRRIAKVFLPRFSDELKAFEPADRPIEAEVLAVDEDRDLALLALRDPPADVPRVTIATEVPYPGQRVAAIGHAGAGMLWAIKGGEVSSTGKLSGHTDLKLTVDEGDETTLQDLKDRFERQGRVVQSTAKIMPGDSGGPLVNRAGELVGVNAFIRTDFKTNQWLSFHVHLESVRSFLSIIPPRAHDFMPDPWRLGSAHARAEDVDVDGAPDVLTLKAADEREGWAWLFDLDQDSDSGRSREELDALVKDRDFDAELVVLFEHGNRHFWYDTDNDGASDLYMVDRGGRGQVGVAYKLSKDDNARADESLIIPSGLDSAAFTDAVIRARFDRVVPVVFPELAQAGAGGGSSSLPQPTRDLDGTLEAVDLDGDGVHDAVREVSAFHQRLLIDVDDSGIPTELSSGDAATAVDPELVAVRQGSSVWVFYDRANAGRFDLAVHSAYADGGIAHEAWTITNDGPKEAREHIGRRLVRPALFDSSLQANAAARTRAALGPRAVADDEGLGSLPAFTLSDAAQVGVPSLGEWKNSIIAATDEHRDMTFIDVDVDDRSFAVESPSNEVAGAARRGEFDAEFVWIRQSGWEWTLYDGDDDGRFELVLYGPVPQGPEKPPPSQAFTLVGEGLQVSAERLGTSAIRWGVFGAKASQDRFKAIAALLFPGRVASQ